MLLGIKSPLGLGFFSAFFMFQLHVYDSLYSQTFAFSRVPSGIAFTDRQIFCYIYATEIQHSITSNYYMSQFDRYSISDKLIVSKQL